MFHHSPFLYRLILLLQRVFISRIIRMGQHHMLHTALPSSTNYSQSLLGTEIPFAPVCSVASASPEPIWGRVWGKQISSRNILNI